MRLQNRPQSTCRIDRLHKGHDGLYFRSFRCDLDSLEVRRVCPHRVVRGRFSGIALGDLSTPRSAIAAPVFRDRAGSTRQRTDTHRAGTTRYTAAKPSGPDAPFSNWYRPAPRASGRSAKTLEIALDRADQAINEGRDAVQGLRASAVETNDLVSAVRILGEELGAADTNQNSVVFEVEVEGVPRNLHPILRDEVYRIAAEALRNAFQHAHAQRIEVEILYGERWLRLRVRDDGKGIEPKFLSADGRAKHYGLHGMRERAQLVGGKLAVWSKLDSGTEVDLSIPASTAYATSYRRRSWLSEKFSRRGTNGKETDVKETKMKS